MPELPGDLALIDDLHLGRPHVIGTYLLRGDEPALVDPGPASTLDALAAGLAAEGVQLADLRSIVLTHIHLDHAGATGVLVRRFPHLRVYVHRRGAAHLANPSKLIVSATRLYGDAMERLWGEIAPVPEQQITTLDGGEQLGLGQRRLRAFDAPGHASHHLVYLDEGSGVVFMGDNGGVCLPGLPVPRPATPPPDIDIAAWLRTLDTVEALAPQALLLTHFGPTDAPGAYLAGYRAALLRWADIVRAGLHSGADEAEQQAQLRAVARADLGDRAADGDVDHYERASSTDLSWQGLARYWRKRER